MPVFPEVYKQISIKRLFHPPLNCSHFSQKSVYQSLVTIPQNGHEKLHTAEMTEGVQVANNNHYAGGGAGCS